MNIKGYYFITDARLSKRGDPHDVREAVKAGSCAVQYRNKEGGYDEQVKEAAGLKELCCPGTLFIINDRVDVAIAVKADGVHIGQDDTSYAKVRALLGPGKVVGVTVHTPAEAVEAERMGADYIGVSPVFETSTKSDAGRPAGIELVEAVRKAVKIPIVAIGGINLENAGRVVNAGADALCAISAVVTKDDVAAEIGKFRKLFKF